MNSNTNETNATPEMDFELATPEEIMAMPVEDAKKEAFRGERKPCYLRVLGTKTVESKVLGTSEVYYKVMVTNPEKAIGEDKRDITEDEEGVILFNAAQVELAYQVVCENAVPVKRWTTLSKGNTTLAQIQVINAAYVLACAGTQTQGLLFNYYQNRSEKMCVGVTMLTNQKKESIRKAALRDARGTAQI